MDVWTILGDIPKKKLHLREDVEAHLNIYMLIRYLNSHRVGINIAEYLNQNYQISLYDAYLFAFYALPKQITEIRWVKGEKIKKDKDIELVQAYYVCSRDVAETYLNILDDKSLKYMSRVISRGLKDSK